jgi:hypothetical protein
MKWTAFIFLLIFTLVQTVPAVQNICNDLKVSIFNPDEEKGTEKVNGNSLEEIKEKKIYLHHYLLPAAAAITSKTKGFRGNKDKLPLPVLDRIILPPNHA